MRDDRHRIDRPAVGPIDLDLASLEPNAATAVTLHRLSRGVAIAGTLDGEVHHVVASAKAGRRGAVHCGLLPLISARRTAPAGVSCAGGERSQSAGRCSAST